MAVLQRNIPSSLKLKEMLGIVDYTVEYAQTLAQSVIYLGHFTS